MSDIKYRVWCENRKEWENDYTFINNIGTVFHQNESGYTINLSPKTHIVEQCTGLKDMDGKLIYEGDIVSLSYGIPPTRDILQVVWFSDYDLDLKIDGISYCGWYLKNTRPTGCSAPAGIEYQEGLKILGNIHENPSLLASKD